MAENQNNQSRKTTQDAPLQDINQLKKVRREKLAELQAAGKDPFVITSYDQTYHTRQILEHYDELAGELDEEGNYTKEPTTVSIAGRMLFKRVMGKASFANLQDRDGRIQIYVSRNDLGDEAYADFKHMDIGDIIGVKGFPFRTKTGEISVHAKELVMLSKSLEPLPEKYHGLQDTDTRYRQRYVDLIVNEEVRETFKRGVPSSVRFAVFWRRETSWRWKRPCWFPTPAALQPGPLRRITMRWMRM